MSELPGVAFVAEREDAPSNAWLTVLTIDPREAGVDREAVRRHLRAGGIEARPVWKPMHLQPAFANARTLGGVTAARLFDHGICLPLRSSLTAADQWEIDAAVRAVCRRGA